MVERSRYRCREYQHANQLLMVYWQTSLPEWSQWQFLDYGDVSLVPNAVTGAES